MEVHSGIYWYHRHVLYVCYYIFTQDTAVWLYIFGFTQNGMNIRIIFMAQSHRSQDDDDWGFISCKAMEEYDG